jgi:hypothetical protein
MDKRKIPAQQIRTQPGMDMPNKVHITSAQLPSPMNN